MKNEIYAEIHRVLGGDFLLESPKDKALAHFALPCFAMAKVLKKSPIAIADEIALKFAQNAHFESVASVKGYVNFKLSKGFLNECAVRALQNPANFARGAKPCESVNFQQNSALNSKNSTTNGENSRKNSATVNLNPQNSHSAHENSPKKEKILLEFVSANPTGPLHIGHARGAIFGDTLARLARHLGRHIDTEYYINDAGKQIRLLGLSVLLAVRQHCLNGQITPPDELYKGEYIVDLAHSAFKELPHALFKDEQNNANIDEIAAWAKDKMLILIKQTLAKAGVKIDKFVSEKAYHAKFDETLKALKNRGAVYESEGKIWLASSQKGDEKDRVIVNERGERSYLAADIVYHADKFARGYTHCINIWGADHHGYIARVRAAVDFLGFEGSRLEVILAQMVSLLQDGKPYKMSKRAGNFILMDEILDDIGADALRFIFLAKKCDTHLEFDIDTLKKQDSSNPVFYINYAHARIHQVFAKAQKSFESVQNADLSSLNEDGANLLFEALNLGTTLQNAFDERALQKIADYLKNLAALFHKFYAENKVVGSAHEDSLLKLFAVVALSIKTALSIMGIAAKEKMSD